MGNSSQSTDQELVGRANNGDGEAMETLYSRHRAWVYNLACRFGAGHSDAEDIVQEVFRYVFLKFPGFKLQSSLTTYLYPVVRNKTIDHFRKLRKQSAVSMDQVPEHISPQSPEMAELSVLDLIAELPEFQREVILLRFVQGLSLQEVSDKLGIPEGTVKSRLHNGLKVLKKLFSIFFVLP